MFSVHAALEKFKNATITVHYRFFFLGKHGQNFAAPPFLIVPFSKRFPFTLKRFFFLIKIPLCWGAWVESSDGEVVRALTTHEARFGPGAICWMSLLLVPSMLRWLLSGFSSWPPSTKVNISKFPFHLDRGPALKPAKADLATSLNIAILSKSSISLGAGLTTEIKLRFQVSQS